MALSEPSSTAVPTAEATPEATQPVIALFQPGTEVEIRTIQMIDAAAGWALGRADGSEDHVLKTSDGGETWQDVTPAEPLTVPSAVDAEAFFLDEETGWVGYVIDLPDSGPIEIHIWRTPDGGRSWEAGGTVSPTVYPENASPGLLFLNATTGWLLWEWHLGMGHHAFSLSRTFDGGTAWQRLVGPPETESTCPRTGMAFADPSNGWMTGECPFDPGEGALLEVSQDGGVSWQTRDLPPPMPGEMFCSARSPYLFGAAAGKLVLTCSPAGLQGQSFLYTTRDGATTWQISSFPGGTLYLLDPDHGWALSKDLYWTEDGGATWTKIKTLAWEGQFSFVSAQLGWAVARSEEETALVRTTDGGRAWELMEPIISP